MVTILASPRTMRAPETPQPARNPLWQLAAGATAAVVAAAVGLAVLCAGTVLLWATGPQSSGSGASAPLRAAVSLWLFALRVPMQTSDGPIRLAPLALTALICWAAVRAAGWAVRFTRAHETAPAATVVLGFTGTFTFVAGFAARGTAGHGLTVPTLSTVAVAVPFAALAALAGVARHTWALAGLLRRTRPYGAMCLRAIGASGLVLAAGGTIVVVSALAVHRGAVAHSFAVSGGGWSGGIGLALLCICYLPTAACWAIAVAAGPGIALATDGRLDLGGADLGALPNLPLVHALPGTGSLPWVAYLTVAVPLSAGIAAGWAVRPAPGRRWYAVMGAAAAAGVLTGLSAGCLAEFSGGGVGGRLDHLGPSGLRVGAALAMELGLAAAVTAGLRVLVAPRAAPTPTLTLVPRARSGELGNESGVPPTPPAATLPIGAPAPATAPGPTAVTTPTSAAPATVPGSGTAAVPATTAAPPDPATVPGTTVAPDVPVQPGPAAATDPTATDPTATDPTATPEAGAEQTASNFPDDPSESSRFATAPDLEDLEDTQELPLVRADPPPPVAAGPDIVG